MLIEPISIPEFALYTLSLPAGPNFEPFIIESCWKMKKSTYASALLFNPDNGHWGVIVLRRQEDHRFIKTYQCNDIKVRDKALVVMVEKMKPDAPIEPLLGNSRSRPQLFKQCTKQPGDYFKLLTSDIKHLPAYVAIGEVYLAMPSPDQNFVSDFQTENFNSRLWELYLLAAFREQGIFVSQEEPSPDFLLRRGEHECYVEAVTAQSTDRIMQGYALPSYAPEDKKERLLGAPAIRFAKTLRNKLQREYHLLPHVTGKPFALALADFHAPSSMVWSREALPTYLYGTYAHVIKTPEGDRAIEESVDVLLGKDKIPAGLFHDKSFSYLSAIIFSNACTLGKFNRMGYLAGFRPAGLRMIREGTICDRKPGALEGITFRLDILSEEYAALWQGGEAWCQELEVYHNPNAQYPIPHELIPGATHFFECKGELVYSTIWEHSILSSVTHLL